MSARDLVVYRKSEELLYKVYPRLINYPKAEKFAEHANSYNFIQSLLKKNDYIIMDKERVFKIDMKIINKERDIRWYIEITVNGNYALKK